MALPFRRPASAPSKTDIWVKNTPDTMVYERYVKDMNGNIKGDKMDAKVRALQKQEKVEKNTAKAAALAKQIKALQAESRETDILTSFHLDHGNGLDPYRVGATLGLGAPSLMMGASSICLIATRHTGYWITVRSASP